MTVARGPISGPKGYFRSTSWPGPMSGTATSTSRSPTRWPRSSGWAGESGLYDTIIRTDSQPITKSPIQFKTGHRHRHRRAVPGAQPHLLRRHLLLRRARDRPDAAAARRPAVVRPRRRQGLRGDARRRDGVLLVAGVRRDARRPLRRAPVGDHRSHRRSSRIAPRRSRAHLPASFVVNDEHYQLKDFSREQAARAGSPRRVDARPEGAAGPPHRRRLPGGLDQELRQGPRVLLDARPSTASCGTRRGCSRCTPRR